MTGRLRLRRRSAAGAAVMIVLASMWVLWGARPALAHASLESSSPGAFAVLEQAPEELRLRFTEPPQTGFSTLRLVDDNTRDLPLGPVTVAADDPQTLTAAVPPLDDGLYVVVWSVVSVDGHRVAGSFAFSVGVATAEAARDLLARVAATPDGDVVLDRVITGVRAWGFVALALLIGGSWLRHSTGAGRHGPARLDHLVWVGWAWALSAAVVLIPLQSAQVTGGSLRDVVDVDRWGQLVEARQGQALVARVVILAVAAWLMARGPHGRQRRAWHPTPTLVGLALAFTHTVAGHAATAAWAWLAVAVTAVHLAAVSGWLGAVAGLVVGARQWEGGPSAALVAVAPLARAAAPAAVVTGAVSAVMIGPPLGDLTDTAWGRWLVVKVGLVALLVGVGALIGRGARRASAPWRPRLLAAEVALGAATLITAAALVSTPPTATVTIEPVTTTLVQGGVLAEVTVTPARIGVNEVHLVMSPPGGALQPVGRVTADLVAVGRQVPPFPVDLAVAGVNHWTAPVQFPYAGRWELVVVAEVRPLEFVQYRTEFTVNE